jgi:hypothetical protein
MVEIKRNVLLPYASSIVAADERLAPKLTPDLLTAIIAEVPDDWLPPEPNRPDLATPAAHRAAYLEYLERRLAAPRAFVEEAERARVA